MGDIVITSNQYIIFTLANETMGIPINYVREVINLNTHNLYRIPGSPNYFQGVINLRGQVIPIIDTKRKFNFGLNLGLIENPKAIIIECDKEQFGLVVDDVEEVAQIEESSIELAPGNLSISHKDQKIGRISGKDKEIKERFVFLLSKEFLLENPDRKNSLMDKVLNEVSIN